MINFHTTRFIKSAFSNIDHLSDFPHVLFIGKSNVGKSSLINALTNNKNLAYVSKKPGQTKLVNYYLVDNKFYLVDVPGFGYRKICNSQDRFEQLMNDYFLNNQALRVVFYLLDSRREITDEEIDVISYIEEMGYHLEIVFTKCDKVKQNEKAKLIASLRKLELNDYLFVSIEKAHLIETLKKKIASFIE